MILVTILVVEIIPVRAIVIKSNYHDDALDYKTTGHNNLPTMPIIPIKHPDRLLIMIFSGSSEKLTSFLPHFSFIFLINHYFLRAVDNDNIWSGSPDKSYFVGVKSQRKCLRQMMWRPIKTLRHVMTNILRDF